MSNQSEKNEDSVQSVTQKFLLDLGGGVPEFINKKCSKCKVTTPQQWIKVHPVPLSNDFDPLEVIALARRLTMCQNCGNISVTN